jgi:hypothetical protein
VSTLIGYSSGTPLIWRESCANSGTITARIASTARSMARRPRNAPAHPPPLLPHLIATLGGSIAALCSRPRLTLDWEFATHRAQKLLGHAQGDMTEHCTRKRAGERVLPCIRSSSAKIEAQMPAHLSHCWKTTPCLASNDHSTWMSWRVQSPSLSRRPSRLDSGRAIQRNNLAGC